MSGHLTLVARHSTTDTRRRRGRNALLAVLAVVLFVASFAGFAYYDLQHQVQRVDVDTLIGPSRPTRVGSENVPDDYSGVAVNILILGSDTREGANNVDGSQGTEDVLGARSDTAMIMHVSADRSRIDVVSIPRDTLVDIPSCTRADGSQTYEQYGTMINTAFANGADEGSDAHSVAAGAACSMKTIEQLTGVHLDEYIVVDFAGLQHMVDALDGVTVYVDEDIDDSEHTQLVLNAGCHHFDGLTALQYARARYGAGDGSDLSRISRQQNLMGAMLRAAKNKNLLTNADDIYGFARSTLSTLTTSPRIGSLRTLAGLAQSLQALGMDKVNFVTMPYTAAPSDPNRVVPSYAADDVWNALKMDQPVPMDTVALHASGATPTPADPSVTTNDDAAQPAQPEDADDTTDSGTTTQQEPAADPAAQCYGVH